MSSAVAMEILCITHIGSISSEKIADVEISDCNIFYFELAELFEKYWKTFCLSPN